jgi:hypothetical protein
VVEEDQARLQKLFKSQEQRRRQLQGVSASEADPPGALRQVRPLYTSYFVVPYCYSMLRIQPVMGGRCSCMYSVVAILQIPNSLHEDYP